MKIEPSADARAAALGIRQLYLAYLEQGFTEVEAMTLVCVSLAAASKGSGS